MEDSQERECHSSLDIMFAGVFPSEFHPNRPTFGTVEGDLPGSGALFALEWMEWMK